MVYLKSPSGRCSLAIGKQSHQQRQQHSQEQSNSEPQQAARHNELSKIPELGSLWKQSEVPVRRFGL